MDWIQESFHQIPLFITMVFGLFMPCGTNNSPKDAKKSHQTSDLYTMMRENRDLQNIISSWRLQRLPPHPISSRHSSQK
jgi:hypothetical protein